MKANVDPHGAARGWRGAACLRRRAFENTDELLRTLP